MQTTDAHTEKTLYFKTIDTYDNLPDCVKPHYIHSNNNNVKNFQLLFQPFVSNESKYEDRIVMAWPLTPDLKEVRIDYKKNIDQKDFYIGYLLLSVSKIYI